MIYKGQNLKVLIGTLSILTQKLQGVIHYPYTNRSVKVNKGRQSTIITATIRAESIQEKNDINITLDSNGEGKLSFIDYYYKRVIVGSLGTFKPIDPAKTAWRVDIELIALDPIKYDTETGDPIG